MEKNDEYYIRESIKEAKKAYEIGEVPVGCVIVKNGIIIARSHNLRETKKNSLYHAEMVAINKACRKLHQWILEDATLYVTLEPCLMCTGAILTSRISRVVYGAKEPKFGTLGSVMDLSHVEKFNHQFEVTGGVCEEEISRMMKEFFRELRKK
jgi:tRNA(adenine34) deaminase